MHKVLMYLQAGTGIIIQNWFFSKSCLLCRHKAKQQEEITNTNEIMCPLKKISQICPQHKSFSPAVFSGPLQIILSYGLLLGAASGCVRDTSSIMLGQAVILPLCKNFAQGCKKTQQLAKLFQKHLTKKVLVRKQQANFFLQKISLFLQHIVI